MKLKLISFLLATFLFSIAYGNENTALIHQIKVRTDKAPDCSSLKTIIADITKGLETNDEKAIAIYNFLMFNTYHRQYPKEKGGVPVLKVVNVYGWSLCGGLHTMQSSLWRELGWKWRYVGWSNPGHTTTEAYYDDQWHYLDVFLKFYTWKNDPNKKDGRTIASQEDIKHNPSLVSDQLVMDKGRGVYYFKDNEFKFTLGQPNWQAPALLVCGDTPEGVIQGVNNNKINGSPTSWQGINFDDGDYKTDINLLPGTTLTLNWNKIEGAHWWLADRSKIPYHSCGDKDFRNSPSIGLVLEPYRSLDAKTKGRSFSNGEYRYEPKIENNLLSHFQSHENIEVKDNQLQPIDNSKPGFFVYAWQSPYVATIAKGQITDVTNIEVSTDNGKTYKAHPISDFSKAIEGNYDFYIKVPVTKPISLIQLSIIVQHNRCALPYLSPGENKITVTLPQPQELKDNNLTITYAFQLGYRKKNFEQLAEGGFEVAKNHHATWEDQVYYIQKSFTAQDLAQGKADIDVTIACPSDKEPLYPRMLFLRREVLTPGQESLALPEGAKAYEVPSGYVSKSLPYPFHFGISKAPALKDVKLKTETVDVEFGFAASLNGEFMSNHFIKTKEKETWAVLLKLDLSKFTAESKIANVRLQAPVTFGHKSAKVKVTVAKLNKPYEKEKAYDFKQIGTVMGTSVIPIQPEGKEYSPAKLFSFDIRKEIVNAIKNGEKEIYVALQTAPDRSVDDGYIVRVDFASEGFKLEVDLLDQ